MARRGAALRVVDQHHTEHDYEAHLDDVAEFAASLPERFLHCRELGHNWRPYTAGRFKDGGFERVLRCTRCRTRRVQELSSRGAVLRNRYEYADGYTTEGIGRIVGGGRDLLRLESMKRIVAKGEE